MEGLNDMKDKLLIWEQHYDMVEHLHIIDKGQLEDFIKEWVNKYIERAKSVKHEYRSHKIKGECVDILFHQHEYAVEGRLFPARTFYDGFQFIELEKTPIWNQK